MVPRTVSPRGTAAEREFVRSLAAIQGETKDAEFAAALGVRLSTWRETRAGRMPLGRVLLRGGGNYVPNAIYEAARRDFIERREGEAA